MDVESITFSCTACGISLTVPSHLAGVSGPCPSCQATIQAPNHEAVKVISQLVISPISADQIASVSAASLPEIALSPTVGIASPTVLRPAPRQLPPRPMPTEQPAARPMPEAVGKDQAADQLHESAAHFRQKNPLLRFLMPFLFIVTALVMVWGILNFLVSREKQRKPEILRQVEAKVSSDGVKLPKTTRSAAAENSAATNESLGRTSTIEEAPTLPEGIEPMIPGKAAGEVLEKFLAAKTLAERLPLIETKIPLADLEKSCLAGPLPPTASVLNDGQEANALERVLDIYFNVDFQIDRQPLNLQTILVRIRGSAAPKIVVEPFLDSFGGRLAAYAKTPTDKAASFQVIVSAIASCNDERVPSREKKLTLKLLARDNTKEIARCYFGRQSKIGAMLEDGTYSISYGKAKACTALLRWNLEDNPAMPYLEALDLNPLDWNP